MPHAAPPRRPIFIGTAGWSIPKISAASFPVEGSHLERYAAVFSTAEINTSFYRPHRRSTYERWSASVPEPFRFAVKAPRSVTHSDWREISSDLDAFFAEIDGLGSKLGPVLVQLPPKRRFVLEEADRFLSAFRQRLEGDLAFEPRHASWFGPDADDLLQKHRISRVAADPPPAAGADQPGGWSGLIYLRLHGSPEIYRSPYTSDQIEQLAREITAKDGSLVWCIFDNTALAAATGDALALKALIEEP